MFRGGVGVTQNGVRGGGGVPRLAKGRSPWTYLKQGVGKRSRRFEPYILDASIKYVIWFCKHCSILNTYMFGLEKSLKKLAYSLTNPVHD